MNNLSGLRLSLLIALGITLGVAGIVMVNKSLGGMQLAVLNTNVNKQSSFETTGESKITMAPDKASVKLGITVNESNVKTAQNKANTISNAIIAELQKLGIDKKDIKTENYSLAPIYNFGMNEPQKITGYTITSTLAVSITDFNLLDSAVDAATKVGANQVGGITFTLSDAKQKEVQTEGRKQAIQNAQEKAQELSKYSGMKLGRVVNVFETPQRSEYQPYMMATKTDLGMGSAPAPTDIQPGQSVYVYSVTLSYETL